MSKLFLLSFHKDIFQISKWISDLNSKYEIPATGCIFVFQKWIWDKIYAISNS